MSLAGNLAQILIADTKGLVQQALQTFQTNVDASPTPATVIAQGDVLELQILAAVPSVEGSLIKDTTNLLVGDAISFLGSIGSSNTPAAPAAPASA